MQERHGKRSRRPVRLLQKNKTAVPLINGRQQHQRKRKRKLRCHYNELQAGPLINGRHSPPEKQERHKKKELSFRPTPTEKGCAPDQRPATARKKKTEPRCHFNELPSGAPDQRPATAAKKNTKDTIVASFLERVRTVCSSFKATQNAPLEDNNQDHSNELVENCDVKGSFLQQLSLSKREKLL